VKPELRQDLSRIQSRKKEVRQLLAKLKQGSKKAVNQLFHTEHEKVFSELNCLDCANCCRTTGPLFTSTDTKRLSAHFKMSEAAFFDKYLRKDEDGDTVLQSLPCPFLELDTNVCTVYEVRPTACRTYPHTDHADMRAILGLTEKNAFICPAAARMVWTILQRSTGL
jgi:uncharacterized protein